LAGQMVIVSADVSIRCCETHKQMSNLVGTYCTKLALWVSSNLSSI